jgi:branched-chain amino acid transport system substrate-binding protein
MLKRPLILSILLGCQLPAMLACSPQVSKYDGSIREVDLAGAADSLVELEPQQMSKPLPWELWVYGRSSEGETLTNRDLLVGDEYARQGNYELALAEYSKALSSSTSDLEQRTSYYRQGAMHLALDRADPALQILSDYFKRRSLIVANVDSVGSLLFAYAYGRKGDFDQSLAWFARAEQLTSASNALQQPAISAIQIRQNAAQGSAEVLGALSSENFERVATAWTSDSFMRQQIALERSRRAREGEPSLAAQTLPFGAYLQTQAASPSYAQGVALSGPVSLAAILPLTGPYSVLGTNVKNGIELALEGQNQSHQQGPEPSAHEAVSQSTAASAAPTALTDDTQAPATSGHATTTLQLSVRDSIDGQSAIAALNELVATSRPSVLFGPLISEQAEAVAAAARQAAIPLICFSKRDEFRTGEGVFRLAPTARSQIESLMEVVARAGTRQRYAGIYADDSNGREFAALFREEVGRIGGQLVLESFYPKGELHTVAALAEQVEQSSAQAVFFPEGSIAAARFMGGLTSAGRRRILSIGSAAWDNPAELRQSSALFEGAVFVSPFFSDSSRPIVRQFIEAYKARFQSAPDFLAAQGFDAATMAAAALKRASQEPLSFIDAFAAIREYQGLTGMLSVRSDGEISRRFSVIEMKDGNFSELAAQAAEPANSQTPVFVLRGNQRVGAAAHE